MSQAQTLFSQVKSFVLYALVFLFPLFFLTTTQDIFSVSKMYLLAFGGLVLFVVSTIELLVTKKLSWTKVRFDAGVLLFLVTIGLSIIISSQNKVQAALNVNLGLVTVLSLSLLYYYISRQKSRLILPVLSFSALIVSMLAILFYFNPFKNVNIPTDFTFLKSPTFTPIGSYLDLLVFTGFFAVLSFAHLLSKRHTSSESQSNIERIFSIIVFIVSAVAALLTGYTLFNLAKANAFSLPPFRLSWFSAVEILKAPLTALFGVGIDNFSSIFTRVKDVGYNQSSLWQTPFFSVSRSGILHVLTEAGIFGLSAFTILLVYLVKTAVSKGKNLIKNPTILPTIFLIAALFLTPISLVTMFLVFILFAEAAASHKEETTHFDTASLLPLYLSITIISFLFVAFATYLLGRTYLAEVYFKRSLDGLVKNNAKSLYDNQARAILFNNFIERFRINFAQTNLVIANNVAQRATQAKTGATGPAGQIQISEQDRQIIAQAIQAAIAEAKSAVALNPAKAVNWENLAVIYRNVLNVAQGADVWTISSYQRAITADPQNPVYRLNLGGVYYSLTNFAEAIRLFEQAVSLKSDWPNAHYNLAWTAFQLKDYQRAASEMQVVITLLDPVKDKADLARAQKEFEEFKKLIPKAAESQTGQPEQLTLPSPVQKQIQPKIELPKTASPEAK